MSLKRWIRRLEREAEEEMVAIPQPDGTVKRFPQSDLMEAFLSGVDRATGKDVPDHPLSVAARKSSEAKWRENFYAGPLLFLTLESYHLCLLRSTYVV